MRSLILSFGFAITIAAAAPAAFANPVVSFGVQAGNPPTTIGGVTVTPADAVDTADGSILFGILAALPTPEDLDALHVTAEGNVLFSTSTSVTLDGVTYTDGDIIEYDGADFSEFFDEGNFEDNENIDALSVAASGELLISTSLDATLFGFTFADGDVAVVDVDAGTAALYMGLDEAAIFTGSNQDIDALHFDALTGNLIISVLTNHHGTIGGLPVTSSMGVSADLFELDLSSGVSGSLWLDGSGLFDGEPRNLNAVYAHPQCSDGVDNDLDTATDFPADVGCRTANSTLENPQCSDGLDNEALPDGRIDFDGGLAALGYVATAPDSNCNGLAWRNSENPSKKTGCGLGGGGLAAIVSFVGWLRIRRSH